MVIAHHPIIFSGLKKLTGSNYVERTIIKAIQNNIAIYASHTNLDNVLGGVNSKIAAKLGLHKTKILSQKKDSLTKLVTFAPKENTEAVLKAMHEAGARVDALGAVVARREEAQLRAVGERLGRHRGGQRSGDPAPAEALDHADASDLADAFGDRAA